MLSAIVIFLLLRLLGFHRGEVKHISIESRTKRNCGVEGAIRYLKELFDRASSELLIVSGHLDPICWNNTDVMDKLKDAINGRSVFCRIISGPNTNLSEVPIIQKFINDKLVEYKALNYEPKGHFIIVDSMHVRLEKPADKMNGDAKSARILWDHEQLAYKMKSLFNDIWDERLKANGDVFNS